MFWKLAQVGLRMDAVERLAVEDLARLALGILVGRILQLPPDLAEGDGGVRMSRTPVVFQPTVCTTCTFSAALV